MIWGYHYFWKHPLGNWRLAGHKPEGLRKRWVFHLNLGSPPRDLCQVSQHLRLRCRVEWMNRNSMRCSVFLYNCFGFQISCRNFNQNCVTILESCEDKLNVFQNWCLFQFFPRIYWFIGNRKFYSASIHRVFFRCQKEVRSGALWRHSFGPNRRTSLGADRLIDDGCSCHEETWLILPVVICLSQRLSHACLSISSQMVKLRMAHWRWQFWRFFLFEDGKIWFPCSLFDSGYQLCSHHPPILIVT